MRKFLIALNVLLVVVMLAGVAFGLLAAYWAGVAYLVSVLLFLVQTAMKPQEERTELAEILVKFLCGAVALACFLSR